MKAIQLFWVFIFQILSKFGSSGYLDREETAVSRQVGEGNVGMWETAVAKNRLTYAL
ncbi:MAG: hypothetical protein H6652_06915 [Ardenticatenaceae bacterium]|nr:hypothetical protein [Ardenticatenaceae bacterium]